MSDTRIEWKKLRDRDAVRWVDQAMGPGWWHYVLDTPQRYAEGSTDCGLRISYEAETADLPKESRHRLIGGGALMDHTEPICDLCVRAMAGQDVTDYG